LTCQIEKPAGSKFLNKKSQASCLLAALTNKVLKSYKANEDGGRLSRGFFYGFGIGFSSSSSSASFAGF